MALAVIPMVQHCCGEVPKISELTHKSQVFMGAHQPGASFGSPSLASFQFMSPARTRLASGRASMISRVCAFAHRGFNSQPLHARVPHSTGFT